LGDRFRMASQLDDEGIFIRSLAASPGHGALAEHLEPMVRLLAAFGFGTVLIETVGAGQGDTEIVDLADIVVLLVQPEAGDDLQWEKAGLLEVADIVVVNKGDLPRAEQVEAQVRSTLELSEGRDVPVLRISAKTGEGIDKLWSAIEGLPTTNRALRRDKRSLIRHAQEHLAAWYARAYKEGQAELVRLIRDWEKSEEPEGEIIGTLFLLARGDASKAPR
jgi:LAO/AO transport system kinase